MRRWAIAAAILISLAMVTALSLPAQASFNNSSNGWGRGGKPKPTPSVTPTDTPPPTPPPPTPTIIPSPTPTATTNPCTCQAPIVGNAMLQTPGERINLIWATALVSAVFLIMNPFMPGRPSLRWNTGSGAAVLQEPCIGVDITPASGNVQTIIDANPVGTTFCFQPGVYTTTVSSLAPKSGDVFDGGNRAATLDGENTRTKAFNSATANNVTVRGFVIKRYNTALQQGAVHSFGTTGWTIENNWITSNAAAGVATDTGARVINNVLDWNAQEGFAAHGSDLLYQGNEIAYNNYNLAVDRGWEAGGGKFWETIRATVKNNNVHHNGGNGLWDDTNNIYITYDGNTASFNGGAGIYHEIGYDGTIINNRIEGNAMGPAGSVSSCRLCGYAWDAGIQIRLSNSLTSSPPLLIARNTLVNNFNGITLVDSPATHCTGPGEGAYGPCIVKNVTVRDNAITQTQGALTGGWQDGAGNAIFTTNNNKWENNEYCPAASTPGTPANGVAQYAFGWFAWNDGWTSTFSTWQSNQSNTHDQIGGYTVGGTCTVP